VPREPLLRGIIEHRQETDVRGVLDRQVRQQAQPDSHLHPVVNHRDNVGIHVGVEAVRAKPEDRPLGGERGNRLTIQLEDYVRDVLPTLVNLQFRRHSVSSSVSIRSTLSSTLYSSNSISIDGLISGWGKSIPHASPKWTDHV